MTLEELVKKRLDEKEKANLLKDTERRVRWTRKELAAIKIINNQNLDELQQDPDFANEYIKKDKVFPKFNIQNEIDSGVSSPTAFLKNEIRRAFPKDLPEELRNEAGREFYVKFATFMYSELVNIKTTDQVLKFVEQLTNGQILAVLATIYYGEKVYGQNLSIPNSSEFQEIKESAGLTDEEIGDILILQKSIYGSGWGRFIYFINKCMRRFALFMNRFNYGYVVEVILRYGVIDEKTYESILIHKGVESIQKYLVLLKEFYQKSNQQLLLEDEMLELLEPLYGSTGFYIFGSHSMSNTQKNYVYFSELKSGKKRQFLNKYFEIAVKRTKEKIEEYEKKLNDEMANISIRENDDWSWATQEAKKTQKGNASASELKINEWEPLSYIERVNGLKLDIDLLKTDAGFKTFFKDVLGIERVTFGASLPDNERIVHIKHYAGSLIDIAEVLDINLKYFTTNQDMGIEFAASGRGRASAHYTSSKKSINLTRRRGDGSLSHELGHYFDNMLYTLSGKIGSSREPYLTNTVKTENSYMFSSLNYAVMMSMFFKFIEGEGYNNLVQSGIMTEQERDELTLKSKNPTIRFFANESASKKYSYIYKKYENIEQFLNAVNNGDEYNSGYYNNTYYLYSKRLKPSMEQYYGGAISYFGLTEYWVKLWGNQTGSDSNKKYQTSFYINSRNMKSPYWSEPWELFARAWETYIYKKLQDKKMSNNYLVSNVYFDHESGVYPTGLEAIIIHRIFDKLIYFFKDTFNVGNFTPFTNERESDFEQFEEDKPATPIPDDELIVEDEPKKKISIDKLEPEFIKKLRGLKDLIESA